MTDTSTLHNYTEMEREIGDICRALFDGLDTQIAFVPIGWVEAAGFGNTVVSPTQGPRVRRERDSAQTSHLRWPRAHGAVIWRMICSRLRHAVDTDAEERARAAFGEGIFRFLGIAFASDPRRDAGAR